MMPWIAKNVYNHVIGKYLKGILEAISLFLNGEIIYSI